MNDDNNKEIELFKLFYKLENTLEHIKDDLCSLKQSSNKMMALLLVLVTGLLGIDITKLIKTVDIVNNTGTINHDLNRLEQSPRISK